MTALKTLLAVFVAGALGGLTSGLVVWLFGRIGLTPATGFNMTPDLTFGWMSGRVFASGIWGVIFLIPIYNAAPLKKGAILGVLPWLSSIFFFLPFKMDAGWLGLALGNGTPLWTLFFGIFWGITGTLFLARVRPQLSLKAPWHLRP